MMGVLVQRIQKVLPFFKESTCIFANFLVLSI